MQTRRLALLAAVLATFLAGGRAGAQPQPVSGRREITMRVAAVEGAAPCNCASTGFEIPHRRQLYMVAIGSSWPLASSSGGRVRLDYVAELLPYVLSRGTANEHLRVTQCGERLCGSVDSTDVWSESAAAGGLLPLGFVLGVRALGGVELRLRAAGGAVLFSHAVPLQQAGQFNFVAEVAPTVELRLGGPVTATVGAVLNHISNAHTANMNPGMNSRMLQVGMGWRR